MTGWWPVAGSWARSRGGVPSITLARFPSAVQAADMVRIVGIGRNEYIATMVQVRFPVDVDVDCCCWRCPSLSLVGCTCCPLGAALGPGVREAGPSAASLKTASPAVTPPTSRNHSLPLILRPSPRSCCGA